MQWRGDAVQVDPQRRRRRSDSCFLNVVLVYKSAERERERRASKCLARTCSDPINHCILIQFIQCHLIGTVIMGIQLGSLSLKFE